MCVCVLDVCQPLRVSSESRPWIAVACVDSRREVGNRARYVTSSLDPASARDASSSTSEARRQSVGPRESVGEGGNHGHGGVAVRTMSWTWTSLLRRWRTRVAVRKCADVPRRTVGASTPTNYVTGPGSFTAVTGASVQLVSPGHDYGFRG